MEIHLLSFTEYVRGLNTLVFNLLTSFKFVIKLYSNVLLKLFTIRFNLKKTNNNNYFIKCWVSYMCMKTIISVAGMKVSEI